MRAILLPFTVVQISLFACLAAATSSQVNHKCYTLRGPSSVSPVPTIMSTVSVTIPVIRKTIYTPTSTITPATSTTTVMTTTTANATTTDATLTDTSTSILVATETSTVTAATTTFTSATTVTQIATVSSGTVTMATPSGFIPVLSSLPGAAKKKKKRDGMALEAHDGGLNAYVAEKDLPVSPFERAATTLSYPQAVTCYTEIKYYSTTYVFTKTAPTVKTTTAPTPLSLTTTISTIYSTNTVVPPDATTTTTSTSITTTVILITPSTTTTTTVTTTTTTTVPAQTNYNGACNSDNIAGTLNGSGIATPPYLFGLGYNSTTDSTVFDCCTSCFSNPHCVVMAFYSGISPGNQCLHGIANNCSYFGEYQGEARYDTHLPPDSLYFISNGICGEITTSREVS